MRPVSLLLLFFLSFPLVSQDSHQHDNKCGYEEWLQEYEALNPGYTEMIQQGLRDFRAKKVSKKRSSAFVLIPVHVILVHAPGQSEGSGTNFTMQHVQSQIDVLNQDFGFYNSDANGVPVQFPAGDTGIQFCLATVDPNGEATDGITRYGTNTNMGNSNGRTEVIAATKWPREDYMNIWSAPNLPFLGLATVPGTGGLPSSNQDFVLVASSTFGGPGFGTNAPYDLGRTTTHEVGHWLGLDHIWGGGCSNDDGIADTPNQSENNFGCPSHPSPSCGNSGDWFMNYMDYTNDACMFSFSLGQGQYMNTILSTSRASLQGSAATACSFVIPLTLTVLDQQDPNCSYSNDGFILVEAAGGSPSYSYSIDGGPTTSNDIFTDLSGGSHSIEAFDSDGTSTSVTVFLNTPTPLVGNAEVTAVNPCPNQSIAEITIDVSGGTNPYFVSLNMGPNQQAPTFDELPNGFYTYQITDNNGCTLEGIIEISGANDIEITVDETQNTTCNGGEDGVIDLSATGGNGPLSYAISGEDSQEENVFDGLVSGDYIIYVTDSLGCFDTVAVAIDEPTEIAVQTTVSNVLCYGSSDGELSISADGGAGIPFIYSVNENDQESGDISSLDTGVYIIIATDSLGCIGIDTVSISQPDSLVAEAGSIEDISCYGVDNGAVNILASGGTSAYQYILETDTMTSGTFTGLAEGSYSITVIDTNECNVEVQFEIANVPAIQVDATSENVSCFGMSNGSLTINAVNTSGTPMYSLDGGTPQSDNTFINLAIGDYTVIISDDTGCDAIAFDSITEPTELLLEVNVASDVLCKGNSDGQAVFNTAGGTAPYFYQINGSNTDPNGLPAGEYIVSVTDNQGCVTESTFTISEPELILEVSYEVNGPDLTIDGTGGTEPYLYSFDGGAYTSDNITSASSDVIIASIKDANNCISTIEIIMSDVTELAADWEINAYPIPMKDVLNLDFNFNKSLNASIQIFDLNGRIINYISSKIYQSGENSVKIDASNFASSIYIVKIASAEGYRYIKVTKM
ncbi:MAG: hypothetical protein ACI86M_003596 [Saprospiraceae bacterium]|jgi:hypothetical protein